VSLQGIREQFPILSVETHGKPLVFLDSAASSQKPQVVLDAVQTYYRKENANIHRGVYALSQLATERYDAARSTTQRFLGAADPREVVFTRGTTEAINLVARSWGDANLGEGDEILLTRMEHHSNIVPWQQVAARTGATIKVVDIADDGSLEMDDFYRLLGTKTKLVGVTHVSNALGTVNPIQSICSAAHEVGARVLVDGAQAVPHGPVDVTALGCDFYVFSGHKVYAPTGIGALYGRLDVLDAMPPYEGGGDMIRSVRFEGTTYAPVPAKFEAGTPNISGAVALGVALEWMMAIGMEAIAAHEADVLAYGTAQLCAIDGIRLVGTAPEKAGVLSFLMDGIHPHDIGTILDREGIAVRTGHHCAQPVMERFRIPATTRASLGVYTNRADLDALVAGIHRVQEILG
jgi:cysteine desulfurase / selenocysteine lyase